MEDSNLLGQNGSVRKDPNAGNSSVLYNFEGSTQNWTGTNVVGGPWSVNEWAYNGSYSLKADVDLGTGKQFYLCIISNHNFSGKSKLKAVVRHAAGVIKEQACKPNYI